MLDPLDQQSADGRILYLYLGGVVVFNAFAEAKAKGRPFPSDLEAVFRAAAKATRTTVEPGLRNTTRRHFQAVAAFAAINARGGSVEAGLAAAQAQDAQTEQGRIHE